MKLHVTFTRFFVGALVVMGFVLPVSAEKMSQPYKSVDNSIVDWWDEFDQDTYSTPDPATQKSKEEYSLSASQRQSYDTAQINVVDWWDEFSYVEDQAPVSIENKHDYPMPKQEHDSSWLYLEDW